jgi:hypothetical protein
MLRRAALVLTASSLVVGLVAGPALACGGLVSPNGTIALVRTTTMAAYHNGMEHYVTGFEFAGGGAEFGSIVPLPGIPKRVIRGGDWTLQRLEIEVNPRVLLAPQALAAGAAEFDRAKVILKKSIDSLDLTVLKGGGFAVGKWAADHGFQLTPDAPAMLDFYAKRSPIFMAVQFNAKRAEARGEQLGDAVPIHLVIPTNRPWVPLRILALGAKKAQPIQADVFLLTDRAPAMLPVPLGSPEFGPAAKGLKLRVSRAASSSLLADLRSDRGMKWLPRSGMWLTFLSLDARASDLDYDLAMDVSGRGQPLPRDAGFGLGARTTSAGSNGGLWALWSGLALIGMMFAVALRERRAGRLAL